MVRDGAGAKVLNRSALLVVALLSIALSMRVAADLERPPCVVEIEVPPNIAPRTVVQRLITAAGEAGFAPEGEIQWNEGYFTAVNKETERLHHRVLVWIGWSLRDPGEVLCVHMMYERLRKYTGAAWKVEEVGEKDGIHSTDGLRLELRRVAFEGFPR